jgi:hypothetical protein
MFNDQAFSLFIFYKKKKIKCQLSSEIIWALDEELETYVFGKQFQAIVQ